MLPPLVHTSPTQATSKPGGSVVRDASTEVQLSLEHARDSLNEAMQKLVEHAAQVQSKIGVEMESLQRVGHSSAAVLAREVQETKDRCAASEMVLQARDREISEMAKRDADLRGQVQKLHIQLEEEREEKARLLSELEKTKSAHKASAATLEAAHAASLAQLGTSHTAAFDAVKQKHTLELAQHKELISKLELQLKDARRKGSNAQKRHIEEAEKVRDDLNTLEKAHKAALAKAQRDSSALKEKLSAVENRLRATLRERKVDKQKHETEVQSQHEAFQTTVENHREEAEALHARISELESLVMASQPKKRLSVSFPRDGSQPVLTRNSGESAITPEEARILMLTKRNQVEKQRLANTYR